MKPPAEVKAQLLAHYATREPSRFLQIDCHTNRCGSVCDSCDDDGYDADGDCMDRCVTEELMAGAPVRILISEATTTSAAIRLLDKAAAILREEPGVVEQSLFPPPPAPAYTERELDILEAIAENVAARDHISFDRALAEVKELAEKGYRKERPF